MLADTTSNPLYAIADRIEPTVELIVFDVDEISFGIPIAKIDRIINSIHLGEDYTLTKNVEILDLHDRLFGISISHPTAIAILIGDSQQLYGIPIDTVPTLTLVPLDRIRTLPSEFRTNNPLGIASHLAIVSTPINELTIFILGS
jgi:chemotaxis signal transduction protein